MPIINKSNNKFKTKTKINEKGEIIRGEEAGEEITISDIPYFTPPLESKENMDLPNSEKVRMSNTPERYSMEVDNYIKRH